ncbi:MAG: pyridoxamine 5'-phosphate oxidase family protein [Rhizobiales bacterium]|nr:pyridoxamine 5'-phosphate oxidase family protein [Hyphomicrobiales bacterium]
MPKKPAVTRSGAPSERTRLRRLHERGQYDHATVAAILDAQPLCTFAYCRDGKPYVVPTFQWREGEHVYWHGSSASQALKTIAGKGTSKGPVGAEVCLNVTILDGLVLARSGFNHSANYRSVTIYGIATVLEGKEEKARALKGFVDALVPGRWDSLRPMTAQEIKATTVLTMPIDEASAKIRTGGPHDDEEDYALPIWAGVLPIVQRSGVLEADPRNVAGVPVPDHLKDFGFMP